MRCAAFVMFSSCVLSIRSRSPLIFSRYSLADMRMPPRLKKGCELGNVMRGAVWERSGSVGQQRFIALHGRNQMDAVFGKEFIKGILSQFFLEELREAAQWDVCRLNAHRFIVGKPQSLDLDNGRAELQVELFRYFLARWNDLAAKQGPTGTQPALLHLFAETG